MTPDLLSFTKADLFLLAHEEGPQLATMSTTIFALQPRELAGRDGQRLRWWSLSHDHFNEFLDDLGAEVGEGLSGQVDTQLGEMFLEHGHKRDQDL